MIGIVRPAQALAFRSSPEPNRVVREKQRGYRIRCITEWIILRIMNFSSRHFASCRVATQTPGRRDFFVIANVVTSARLEFKTVACVVKRSK